MELTPEQHRLHNFLAAEEREIAYANINGVGADEALDPVADAMALIEDLEERVRELDQYAECRNRERALAAASAEEAMDRSNRYFAASQHLIGALAYLVPPDTAEEEA